MSIRMPEHSLPIAAAGKLELLPNSSTLAWVLLAGMYHQQIYLPNLEGLRRGKFPIWLTV